MADPVNVLAPMSGAAPLNIPNTPKPSVNPDELLSIGDIPSTRKRIYSRVLSAASSLQPLENDQYRLQLENVQYDPADPEEYGAKAHKQAILENRTLGRRLRGQWTLYDKRTNQPIDRKRTTIATVPWLSSDGAFINNGVDTSLSHQMRLRPGVYARIKQTGEIESHANILPGKGPSHRYRLDPETGKFVLEVHQANLPLMPLLRAAGLTDKELEEAWGSRGRDLVRLQHEHDTPANLARVYKAIAGRRADPNFGSMGRPEQQQAVASLLANWEVDPEISKRTLGGPYATIDKDALKAITAKLVRLAEGSDEIDDRDQLAYQTVLGPDDLMAERIARDYGRAQRGIFREAARRGNVQFMPSNTLQRQLMSVFTKSGLANSLEEANPSEVLDRVYRVSRLGEGGLPSTDSVPEASRMVSPSHYGFIDPARTVECYAADMEVMTHRGWLPWSKVTPDDKFACLIGGKLAYRRASALHSGDYVGPMYGARTARVSYLVTPQHRMWVRPGDTGCLGYRFEYAEDMHGTFRKLKCGGHGEYRGRNANIKHFEVPGCIVGSNSQRTIPPIAVDDWYELLGWYLSEGSYVYDAQTSAYRIDISQSKSANPENYARIDALLSRLPMAYSKDERGFSLSQKQLAAYFRQFGDCAGKYIPADAFEAPLSARRRLLESLLLGDGSRETRGNRRGVRVMYSSGSKQLAEDVQCLLFGLGVSSKITIGIDKRKETYLPRYKVNIHENQERELRGRNDHYFIEMYEGKVYCATVPGGLLYVRRDRQTGFWSGNSLRVGVDLYLAGKLRRDADGNIYAPMQNRQTGETEWKTPREVVDLSMGFDERSDRKRVPAITGGKLQYAEQDKVSHGLQHFEDAFSPLAQLIPMKSGVAPQRVAMGSRMLTQAVALAEPEAPLVRGAMPDNPDQSYEEHYGTAVGAIRADRPGQVLMATPEFVRVRYDDGETKDIELDNNRPLNRKSFRHQTPVVQPGQTFGPGDLLARSNYTDDKGVMALGANFRTAYMPFRGLNHEDAIVISASAAKRLTSEQAYQHTLDRQEDMTFNKDAYQAAYPQRFSEGLMSRLDKDGVIQPGQTVEFGDPLAVVLQQSADTGGVVRGKRKMTRDASLTWDHETPGVITDVAKTKDGINIVVKSMMPMQTGDKLAPRYGDKGVVHIVKDDDMPIGQDGKPIEIIVSDLGVLSRANPAQVAEALLGKVARKTGKPVNVPDFKDIDDLVEWAHEQARIHGISAEEDLIDPRDDRKIPQVLTGERFFMKLHHQAESKGQGRGTGGYTCFDADTEVLTERGWVRWPDVTERDKLATLRGERIVFEKPLKLVAEPFDGEMYGFSGRYVDYLVTPNHRMFVRSDKSTKHPFGFKTAEAVYGKRFCVRQAGFGPAAGTARGKITIPEPPQPLRRKHAYAAVTLDRGDYAEFMGWWLSEGDVTCNLAKNDFRVRISQHEVPSPGHFKTIERLLNRLPFKWYYATNKGKRVGFIIKHKGLAYHVKQFGSNCYNKRIPRELLRSSLPVRERLFSALIAGDGSRKTQFYEYSTTHCMSYVSTSYQLASDFQELCLLNGLGGALRANSPRPGLAQSWTVGVAVARSAASAALVRTQPRSSAMHYKQSYVGTVYCATMETGLLLVRRNGKPLLTGNSEERPSKGGEEGCFVATQRVVTSRGWMPIGRICEKRRGEQVLTYSERLGEWVFRPITNWFTYDAPVENVLSIECYGPCENSKGSDVKKYTARHHINATKRHSMLLYDGTRKRAGDLRVGDELVTWGVKPTQHQHELLVGMLMGDGSVSANVIGCTHSGKQDPYFDWKLRMLASLSPTWCEQYNEPSIGSGGYPNCGGRYRVMSITNRLLAEPYADLCLRDGQRTVTHEWLAEMTGLSVAVLFLDDGTATSKGTIAKSRYPVGSLEREKFTGALCTQGFTRKGVERLRRWLMAKYDIKCGIGADNRITLSTRACRALIREVAAWIPWQVIPRSKRGIRRVVKRLQEVTPPHTLNVVSKLVKRPMPVRSITPYRARKGRTTVKVYDVEVAGTHTYCAGPALVSNSKTIGLLQSNAVMSHGATGLLRDAATVRGQANADYWMAVRQGIAPPKPKVPFTYERFINELSAAGINTVSDGDQMHIMALTDKDINERAGNREIQRNDLVRLDDKLSPVTGGLFDQALTGGHGGNAWAKITLPEPMPNPVMEEPIRRVLNLTQNKFRDVLAGRESIATGSGPQAIYRALDAIDLPKELARIRETLKTGRKSARDLAERQLGYLKTAERVGQHPREWMLNSIPVLPPRFRPISLMQHNNQPLVSDINYLYREAIDARDNLKSMSSQVDDVGDERLGLYDAFRAITGMADPQHPKLVEKQVGGVLGRIFGKGSSKYGTLQRKLLSRQVDLVGRGVIVPNPDLDMDSVGLPERRVWPLYGEFVTRRLRRRGFPLVRAMQEVEKRTPLAREELLREMQERPVFVDRAPVLHRFGTMAFYPKLVVGNSIHVSPAVLTGFAADFDGDAVQYHVPADDSAIPEILDRMLPSKNLLSPADFKSPMYVAGKEFIGGLFKATQAANPKARTVRFLSRKDALAAARRGELPLDTPIEVDD